MNKNYTRIIFSLCILLVFSEGVAQTKTIPYQQLQGSTGMFFGASMTTSNITITFAGPSNKWIALGFGTSMTPADALIYTSGQSSSQHTLGWTDYFCGNQSASNVTMDNNQNWTVLSNLVASGQRTVVAVRNLNTSDASDVVISFTSTALNIVWARGATNDYTLAYHGNNNRGSGITLPWLSQPSASFSVNSQTVCVGTNVTFTNLTSGGQTTYTWALPGTTLASSSATNPVVTYTAAGVYSVVLTASNVIGTNSLAQIGYITVNPTMVPTVSIVQSSGTNPLCQGSLATFSVNTANTGPSPQFQWRVNNQVVGGNTVTFSSNSIGNASSIICIVTSPSVCASPSINTSAALVLTVNSNAPASVSVTINSGSNPMCVGALTSFSAVAGNGGNAPTYQWQLNGSNVGTSNSTFTSNTLSNGDVIACGLVSNAICAVTTTALSSAMVLTVSSLLVPSVSISSSAINNSVCVGSLVNFIANASNGGTNPSYQWQLNGNNVGSNNSIYSVVLPSSSNIVTCILNSNSQCANPTSAISNSILFVVHPIPPAPTITPGGNINLCSGSSIVLTSSSPSGNTWSNALTTNTIRVVNAGLFTVTQTQFGCTSAPSASVSVTLIPSPTIVLTPVLNLCKDDDVYILQANPSGGIFSGTGVNGSNFNTSTSGTGSFTVTYLFTDANNCSETDSMLVRVSECVGMNALTNNLNHINIYPNPNNGNVMLFSESSLIQSITITDINGKVILKRKELNLNYYELKNISEVSGIYNLEIITTESSIHKRIQVLK